MEVSRWSCLDSEERARSLGLIRRGVLSVVGPQELKAHACMTPRLCGCPLLDANTLSNPGLSPPHNLIPDSDYQASSHPRERRCPMSADVPSPPMSQVPSPPMFHVHLAMKCDPDAFKGERRSSISGLHQRQALSHLVSSSRQTAELHGDGAIIEENGEYGRKEERVGDGKKGATGKGQ